jgi:phosphoesterase RecJ-like protein
MKTPEEILSVIKKEDFFLIASHLDPDGDALGSSLGLSIALESIGKKTFVYNRDPLPEFYRFMPGCNKIKSNFKNILKKNPVLILLDCNSPERAAIEGYRFKTSLVIDHHETQKDFGDIRWIDYNAAATGMIVFSLIKELGITFTKNIATNLYIAIAEDTGTFRYNNTTAKVLATSAELVGYGAVPGIISENLYESWDRKRFDLLVMALNNLEIKNEVGIMHITKDMFKKTGTSSKDTENFSNYSKMVKTVKISTLIRETGSGVARISLRSKGNVNVAKIAELYGGGGHKNAAGFKTKSDIYEIKKSLFKEYRKLNR